MSNERAFELREGEFLRWNGSGFQPVGATKRRRGPSTLSFVFMTDCRSLTQGLQSPKELSEREAQHQLIELSQKIQVVLQWVPAHCGLAGNEQADRPGKGSQATRSPSEKPRLSSRGPTFQPGEKPTATDRMTPSIYLIATNRPQCL